MKNQKVATCKTNKLSMVLLIKPLILFPQKYILQSSEQEQSPVIQNDIDHKLKKKREKAEHLSILAWPVS